MTKDSKSMATPRLRFPEFRESEEWKGERMAKLYSFMRNNALSRDKLNYESGTVKNIHYGDIHTKFSALFDITKERVPYVNPTEELPDSGSEDYCVEGDIIFTDASEDTNDVGKSIEIVRLNGERLLSGQHTILARRKDKTLIIGFGGHLFQSRQIRSQIQKEAQGTKVYAISSTRLANIGIAYPSDGTEQQKITDCLTSLDEVIAAQRRKVEALKAHKQGMMQQLFPREGETLPHLRFPEFRDGPEWEERTLGEISKLVRGPFGGSLKKEIFVESGYAVYEQSHAIYSNFVSFRYYISQEKFDDLMRFAVAANDIIMSCSGTMGKFAIIPHGAPAGVINQALLKLTAASSCNPRFLKELLELPRVQRMLLSQSGGGAIQNIVSVDQIKALPLRLPSESEQRKVADCFSSLDAQIAAESKKLDALNTHKKGLMQQLFPSPEEV